MNVFNKFNESIPDYTNDVKLTSEFTSVSVLSILVCIMSYPLFWVKKKIVCQKFIEHTGQRNCDVRCTKRSI